MTVAGPAAGGGDSLQVGYEALRSVAVGGSSAGPRLGLIVLLREGVAAWVARRSTDADLVKAVVPWNHQAGTPPVSDDIHVGVVRVLASMALGGCRKEKQV